MLADTNMVGDPYLWIIGPIVVFLALTLCLALTLTASRKFRRPHGTDAGLPHRGAVTGGIIEGSPSQRNRRDAAPTAAEREAAREAERREAAALGTALGTARREKPPRQTPSRSSKRHHLLRRHSGA
ncbi:hypothetical protein [Actinomadura macra]|uniref:hypothetical protein n=1 Tax=Actinomadura macra TaxID=46164 RepID=UPI00082E96F1|nr:hypothetical protein [Actinomadura macra]